jgi:hypothetical protein
MQWFWLPQPAQDCPKMALSPVKMAQDRPKTAPRRSQDDLEGYFFALENRLRFLIILGSILAPFWLPKCLPLGTLLALQIDQKNDPKSDCLQGRSKIAPRAPKTLPRRPPEPPGMPQDSPRGLPDPPRTPSGCPKKLPGSPRTTQNVFRSSWPNNLFRKNRKIRNRRKMSKTKSTMSIHGGRSTQSLAKIESRWQRPEPQG